MSDEDQILTAEARKDCDSGLTELSDFMLLKWQKFKLKGLSQGNWTCWTHLQDVPPRTQKRTGPVTLT